MNRLFLLLAAAPLFLPATLRADDSLQVSAERLDILEHRGYFTPAFKKAVQQLVEARQAVERTREDEATLRQAIPGLQAQQADLQAQLAALHKELAFYEHPEDSDYDALQAALKNPASTAEERLMLAQAFVWSYPTDPRQADAEEVLRQIQKQISDQQQAARDAAAAQAAARARLEQRAAAHDLSLAEWQDFLRDMSQEDLLGRFGPPQSQGPDYWIYSGAWTTDPATKAKTGLRIDFNGTRVMDVVVAPQ